MSMEERIRDVLQTEASQVETTPNLKRNVMQKIDSERGGMSMRKRWIAGIVAAIILVPASAYAATQAWELFNKEGQLVLDYRGLDHQPRSESVNEKIQSVHKTLQPGQAVMIYVAGAESLTYSEQPLVYHTLDDLHRADENLVAFPNKVRKYAFAEGGVNHQLGMDPKSEDELHAAMKAEAESNKTDLVVREAKQGKLASVYARYGEGQDSLNIFVTLFTQQEEHAVELQSSNFGNESKEKVTIAGREVLYKTTSEQDGSLVQSLIWVEEGKDGKQLYQVRTQSPNLTKNEFLAMVAQIKPE